MKIKVHDDLLQAEMTVSFRKQKMVVSIYMIDGLLIDTGPPNIIYHYSRIPQSIS